MMKKTSSALGVIVLLAMLLAGQQLLAVQAEIQCSEVVQDLLPCLEYLQGNAASPSAGCCSGVRALYAAADSTEERQATCDCLKAVYLQYDVQVSAAQALPNACGLALPFITITPDIDCTKIP